MATSSLGCPISIYPPLATETTLLSWQLASVYLRVFKAGSGLLSISSVVA